MKTKTLIFTLIISGIWMLPTEAFSQKANSVYYFSEKSAIIEYAYSGQSTGTETWYMDDNGHKSARYSELTTKSFGTTSKTKQIIIQQDSIVYTIDLVNKTGVKQNIHMGPKDFDKWTSAEQAYTDMGFKKIGDGEVLGRKCEIWEGMSTKVWIWKMFALKTEMNIMGKTVIEATKADVGVRIDKSKFEIPDGIVMTESTFNANNVLMDSLGVDFKKGISDLKDMFGPKKKK